MPRQSKYIPLVFLCLCLGGKGMADTLSTDGVVKGGQEKRKIHGLLVNADEGSEERMGEPFKEENVGDIERTSTHFGIGQGFADPLFALSKGTFKTHLNGMSSREEDLSCLSFVADRSNRSWTPAKRKQEGVWIAPFAFHANHQAQKDFSSLSNRGLGGILGIDYSGFGAGIAYTYQSAHGVEEEQRAYAHQELGTVYGSWTWASVFVEGALWGGFSQTRNHRLALGSIPSRALVKGTLLSPHLKIGTAFGREGFLILPFAEFDWAHLWQGAVKESGKPGLNLQIDRRHLSILRSEFGFQFAQRKKIGATLLALREGIGYVNKTPFCSKSVQARYSQSPSFFPIALLSRRAEHLFALFLSGAFSFKNESVPVVSFGYQGEFGAKTMGHSLTLECQKRF